MVKNFQLRQDPIKVVGYDFPCENPKAIMFIIHGIGEYAGRFQRMAGILAESNIKVLSMDLRGHGISNGVRGDASPRKDILEDIDLLIKYGLEEYPGLPAVLYGHSMGGNIALDYKFRGNKNNLMDGFIISAPWIRLVRPVSGALYHAVRLGAKLFPHKQIKSECNESDLGNPLFVQPYKTNTLVHGYISLLCAFEGFEIGQKLEQGILEDNGGSRHKPFLVMHGTGDKICDFEGTKKFAEAFADESDFELVLWDGYLHEIHNGNAVETGDKVIEKIKGFILKLIDPEGE